MAASEATLRDERRGFSTARAALAAGDNTPLYGGTNLGIVALVAMFLSTFMWGASSDAPPPPMGNTHNYYRMGLVMFAGSVSVFALLRNPHAWVRAFPGPLLLLLAYGILAMISSSFIPEYALYSLWKSLEVVVLVLAAAAILSYPSADRNALSAYRAIIFLNLMLVIVYAIEAIAMPERALEPARGILRVKMSGVMPSAPANGLAFLSALSALAMFARFFRPAHWFKKLLCALLFLIAVVVLVFAQSRTSFVGFCLAVAAYLVLDRRFLALSLFAALVLLAGIYASFFDVFSQYLLRGQEPELVRNLSGRTDAWFEALTHFQEAPLLGHGFAAYARAAILGLGGFTSMHGAVFEVMVGTGAFGLIAWGGGIVWTLVRLYALSWSEHPLLQNGLGRSVHAEMLGLTVLIVLRGSTSSGLAEAEDNFMLFLALLAYTELMRRGLRGGPGFVAGRPHRTG